jgi:Putative methyltransferase
MSQTYSPRAALSFFSWSVLCQIMGFLFGQIYLSIVPSIIGSKSFIIDELILSGLLIFHSIAAYFAARLIKLPLSWGILNLLIAPSVILYVTFDIPQWPLALAIALTAIIYLPTFWTRVPFYPTSRATYDEILKLLPEDKELNFIDIGCGFGTMLFYLSKKRPKIKFYGVELGPLPLIVSFFRSLFRSNLKINSKNFWAVSLSEYQIAYAFLAPDPMPKLWDKAKKEMKPGSVFISNSFPVPGRALKEIKIEDNTKSVVYVYTI